MDVKQALGKIKFYFWDDFGVLPFEDKRGLKNFNSLHQLSFVLFLNITILFEQCDSGLNAKLVRETLKLLDGRQSIFSHSTIPWAVHFHFPLSSSPGQIVGPRAARNQGLQPTNNLLMITRLRFSVQWVSKKLVIKGERQRRNKAAGMQSKLFLKLEFESHQNWPIWAKLFGLGHGGLLSRLEYHKKGRPKKKLDFLIFRQTMQVWALANQKWQVRWQVVRVRFPATKLWILGDVGARWS